MSSTSFDLGGDGNSFPFDEIGDKVTGKVLSMEEQQQTDMDTGEPKTWQDGKPMTMIRIELQTKLREYDGDNGVRSVYAKGSKKEPEQSTMSAIIAAVKKATGRTAIDAGGLLTLEFIEEDAPKRRGHNGRKRYAAKYVAPSVQLGDDDEEEADERPVRRPKAGRQDVRRAPTDDDFEDVEEEEPRRPAKKAARRPAPVDDRLIDEYEDEAPAPAPRKRRQPVADLDDDDASDALRV